MSTCRHVSFLLFASVGCVVEGGLVEKEGDPPAFDSTATPPPDDSGSTSTAEEDCNGADDDGDGAVDEGWPDEDGNGRADCLDTTCPPLDLGTAGTIPVEPDCVAAWPVADPWNVEVRWQVSGSAYTDLAWVYATPMVGNLDDDDGDGRVDAHDDADVVVNAGGTLLALEGATGAEKWAWEGVGLMHSVAVADVTGDGRPDVVSITDTGEVLCLDGDGALLWKSTDTVTNRTYAGITAADLDGDGTVEVIADDLVVSGADGETRFSMGVASSRFPLRTAAVADIDLDGDQEVLMAGSAWDDEGHLLWTSKLAGEYGMWPLVVQADGDPAAEVAFVGDAYTLFEDDGTLVTSVSYGAPAHPGPPCVGDFDGDGGPEVGWPAYGTFHLVEPDGTTVWTAAIADNSGFAGCSGWDVDGDGVLEVLYADEEVFRILDGATGLVRYEDPNHHSSTIFEYPSVANVDQDGHGEILVGSSQWTGAWGMLTVYGHAGDGWPAAGADWGLHDYSVGNLDVDGRIPSTPAPVWTDPGVYRARAPTATSRPDLVARITDVCVADCTWGPVMVGVQVENRGPVDVAAGVPVTVYAVDSTGTRAVAGLVLPAIPAGTALEGTEVALGIEDLGADGFSVVVDPDRTLADCDVASNTDTWRETFCP